MSPKILFVGPLKDFSGYASASRDYVRALHSAGCELVTRDLRYDGGNYQRSQLEEALVDKPAQGVDIVIQQTTPVEMAPKKGCFNVGIFCWETDRIPDIWVQHLNQMDLILVPSKENLEVTRRCGVVVPVELVPYATDLSKYSQEYESYLLPHINNTFKFLSIFQYAKKKGLDPLLKAYFTEFSNGENVSLILKTYFGPNDSDAERQQMQQIIGVIKKAVRLKKYPPIHLIHEVLDFDQINRLYATADCYCLPSRGEGWGVPHFDALGFGLPTIATAGTGPEEFITKQCGWLVKSHMSPVVDMPHPHDFLYTAKENWHEPQVDDLRRCMREAFELWKLRDKTPAWANMQEEARARTSDFSHINIGVKLKNVILRYYEMWREANVR